MALRQQVVSTARRQRKPANSGKLVDKAEKAAIKRETEARLRAAEFKMEQLKFAEAAEIEAASFKTALTAKLVEVMAPPKSPADAQKALDRKTAEGVSEAMRGELKARQRTAREMRDFLPERVAKDEKIENHLPEKPPDLVPTPAGPRPAAPSPAGAVPPPLPDSALDTSSDRAESDAQYASEGITQHQLKKSNESSFVSTAQARDQAEAHSEAGPKEVRDFEAGIAERARNKGAALLAGGMNLLAAVRSSSFAAVFGFQNKTKTRQEREREAVTAELHRIQEGTRKEVDGVLTSMEQMASFMFDLWLDQALSAFKVRRVEMEKLIRQRMRREHGIEVKGYLIYYSNWVDWVDLDKEQVEEAIRGARQAYEEVVARGIDHVAGYVGRMLAYAKREITRGHDKAHNYVKGLKGSVKTFGEQALMEIDTEFEMMSTTVDSRRDGLIDRLGSSYAESERKVEELAQAFRDANKSWWQKLKEKVKGVIRAIRQIKDLFFTVLRRVAGIIGDILSSPGDFFSTLVSGAKQGFLSFKDKILTYLEQALHDWMKAELGATGLEIPERRDAVGIFGMIVSILGLSYAGIRARAVRLFGENSVARLEGTAEVFRVVRSEGPAGLWAMLQPKLESVKDQAIAMVQDLLIVKIIKAGVIWVLSLFNPVSGFIKACKAIYSIVMFFVERASQIAELINAVLDAMTDAVSGNVGAVARRIETALANALSLVIGLLASLLNISGMGNAIRGVIERIRAPVDRAIDWLLQSTINVAKVAGRAIGDRVSSKPKAPTQPAAGAVPAKLPSDEVKEQAREQIFARLTSEHSFSDAVAIVADIGAKLRPYGLKRLWVERPDKDGSALIVANASANLPLGALRREVEARDIKGAKVRSHIEIKLVSPVSMPRAQLESAWYGSRKKFGAEVWSQGATVNFVSWNTGYLIDAKNNLSHAEHQFANYMESKKGQALWPEITNIKISNYYMSPCGTCSEELSDVLTKINNARISRGLARVEAGIWWTKLYTGPSPTSWESLHDLQKAKWDLHAPDEGKPEAGGKYYGAVTVHRL